MEIDTELGEGKDGSVRFRQLIRLLAEQAARDLLQQEPDEGHREGSRKRSEDQEVES